MTIKLIASDIDGTLLNDNHELTPELIEVVEGLSEKGVILTLATGRMFESAIPIAEKFNIDVPIISYNGGLIKRGLSGEVISDLRIELSEAKVLIDYAHENNLVFHTYINDVLYIEYANEYTSRYEKIVGTTAVVIDDIFATIAELGLPTKILYWCEPDELKNHWNEVAGRLHGGVFITQSAAYFLEFVSIEAGKGNAVRLVAKLMDIDTEDILGIGDNINDMTLLEAVGTKVAMGNAVDELKAIADFVTESNNENGWAKAINNFI